MVSPAVRRSWQLQSDVTAVWVSTEADVRLGEYGPPRTRNLSNAASGNLQLIKLKNDDMNFRIFRESNWQHDAIEQKLR